MSWIDQLPQEMAALEARVAHMIAVNRIVGARGLTADQKALRLCRECGLKLAEADCFVTPDELGRTGFSKFEIAQKRRSLARLRRTGGER